jgi:hypothetical protein
MKRRIIPIILTLALALAMQAAPAVAGTVTSGSVTLSCTTYAYNNFTVYFDRNNSGTGYENLHRDAHDGAGTLLRAQDISYWVGTSQTWTSTNSFDLASPAYNPITFVLISQAGGAYTSEQVIYSVSYTCPGLPDYVPPPSPLSPSVFEGPGVPGGFVLRTMTCDMPVLNTPAGSQVGSNMVKAGQTFFVNPKPVIVGGVSYTELFAAGAINGFVKTVCVH